MYFLVTIGFQATLVQFTETYLAEIIIVEYNYI